MWTPLLRRAFSSGSAGKAFDVAVVGGGPGGYAAAIRAAQLGLRTVCIEKRGSLGGTCLNVGCIPSKTLLDATHKFHEAIHEFPRYGVRADSISMDLKRLMEQKNKCVKGLTTGIEGLFKANSVTYERGVASLVSDSEIDVLNDKGETTQRLKAEKIILAPGSESAPLPNVPVDEKMIVSSTGALDIPSQMPEKIIVIGGGVIGLELGSVYARLGSKVTVVEFLDRITPGIDHEIALLLQRHLHKQLGMQFMLGTKVMEAKTTGGGETVSVKVEEKDGTNSIIEAQRVLLAVGRRPATSGKLNLHAAGVELDKAGRIKVDGGLRASANGKVFAVGDAIAGPMLAHKAEEEGVAVAEFIARGTPVDIHYNAIPSVVYTQPEVAGVGKTEEQLRNDGVDFVKASFPMKANSRARAVDSSEGLVKVLAEKATGRLVGAWLMADHAGEMIHELALAVHYGASAEDVGRLCHAHPTLSEAIKEACMGAYDMPIHLVPSKKK